MMSIRGKSHWYWWGNQQITGRMKKLLQKRSGMKFVGILFLTSMLLRCELPKKRHAYRKIQGRQLSLLTALSFSKHRNCFLQGDVHLRSNPCSSFCLLKSHLLLIIDLLGLGKTTLGLDKAILAFKIGSLFSPVFVLRRSPCLLPFHLPSLSFGPCHYRAGSSPDLVSSSRFLRL